MRTWSPDRSFVRIVLSLSRRPIVTAGSSGGGDGGGGGDGVAGPLQGSISAAGGLGGEAGGSYWRRVDMVMVVVMVVGCGGGRGVERWRGGGGKVTRTLEVG